MDCIVHGDAELDTTERLSLKFAQLSSAAKGSLLPAFTASAPSRGCQRSQGLLG